MNLYSYADGRNQYIEKRNYASTENHTIKLLDTCILQGKSVCLVNYKLIMGGKL